METKEQSKQEIRNFVRIANTDLDVNKSLMYALTKIKGIGYRFADVICNVLDLDKLKRVKFLNDDEINKLEIFFKDLEEGNFSKYNIPNWLLNRSKDIYSGEPMHKLGPDLKYTVSNDIKLMMKIKSYKGLRHAWGLPVRGQRTKSNFRPNKGKNMGGNKKKGPKRK